MRIAFWESSSVFVSLARIDYSKYRQYRVDYNPGAKKMNEMGSLWSLYPSLSSIVTV